MTEPEVAREFGTWKEIGFVDARTAKRAVVRCKVCRWVREIGAEALLGGQIVPCVTCSPPSGASSRRSSFAADLAVSETRGARRRKWGK
jgi:hypothetical protein